MPADNAAKLQGAARGLSQAGLVAVGWAGCVIAGLFVALRCAARYQESRRLFADDYWVLAALVFLLVNAILQTLQASSLYYLVYVSVGRVPAGAALLAEGTTYVYYEFVVIGLFWTVLWCIKASFLALFYRLFDGLPVYRKMWWAVVFFSILGYIGCWIASVWTCHPPSTYFQFGKCTKPIDIRGSNISISYSTAVDIVSDLMIMLLPLRLLPKLQVTKRQKAGLAGVFCIGILVIASAIARLTQIIGQERSDPVGLAVWGLVESSVSVIVGSLPPLKSVLGRRLEKTRRRGYSPYADPTGGSGRGKVSSMGNKKSGVRSNAIPLDDHSQSQSQSQSHHVSKNSTNSLKGQIVVQQDFGWVRSAGSESEADAGGHDGYDDEVGIIDGLHQNPQSRERRQVDLKTFLKG